MRTRATPAFFALLLVSTFSVSAFDQGPIRRATERGGNWLTLQYEHKTKQYPGATTPEQEAMVLKALGDNPREYREASGPYMSQPVKDILSKVDDAGKVSGIAINESEAILWVITGLKAVKNDAYLPVIEKLRARVKELGRPAYPKFEAAHLKPTAATPESMRNAIGAIVQAAEAGKKEIDVDGQPVKWAEVLGDSIAKLQQESGQIGPDIQTHAMALYVLNLCIKSF